MESCTIVQDSLKSRLIRATFKLNTAHLVLEATPVSTRQLQPLRGPSSPDKRASCRDSALALFEEEKPKTFRKVDDELVSNRLQR